MTAPSVDAFNVLWVDERWIALGPLEARIARELATHQGEVVPRARIETAWGSEPVRPNTVDRQMHRLRLHFAAVGLALHTIRGQGYLLEAIANLTSG
jgi:DNA-binding response OmpR family regulator